MDSAPPSRSPKTRGTMRALWLLITPPRFDAVAPAHGKLTYRTGRVRGIRPLADVYVPDQPRHGASVIVVHGGGFLIGSRKMKPVRFVATRLCRQGYTVATFDYRLIFRGGRLDEQLSDVMDVSTWWAERQERFGLDPNRVSMLGFSAGATLMLLHAALTDRPPIERLVSVYGLYDFTRLGGRSASWLRRRVLRSGDEAVWTARSPVTQCEFAEPLLMLHGTADTLVPIVHADRLAAPRDASGLPTELAVYDGEEHGFMNDASLPATHAAMDRIIEFLGDGVRQRGGGGSCSCPA